MRILFVDVDSLRPDHLGCYGYERNTSPTIDRLAQNGHICTQVYTADAPCLPSRTGLFTGRFGLHTGVINHGGSQAEPRRRGRSRLVDTRDKFATWPMVLKQAGYRTGLISPFPTRHGAWHVLEGFDEWTDTGKNGHERAEIVAPRAVSWLDKFAEEENWYLHVNFWDPHTLYTTPLQYGNPFDDDPTPQWLSEDRIADHRTRPGPFSARDLYFYGPRESRPGAAQHRMPDEIRSRNDFGILIDGYDTAIRYFDEHLKNMLSALEQAGVREDTLIVISADHGENLGELNVYGDHVTADEMTCHVPLIVSGPQIEDGVETNFHYQLDLGPTIIDLADIEPVEGWDGRSFAPSLRGEERNGRDSLVFGQAAWTAQRGVRWDDWLLVRTYHNAYMDFPSVMLFDLDADPHQTTNLAQEEPQILSDGLSLLQVWLDQRLSESARGINGGNPEAPRSNRDPLWEVLAEGGPLYPRGPNGNRLEKYCQRLRETDRGDHADRLERTKGFVGIDRGKYLLQQ